MEEKPLLATRPKRRPIWARTEAIVAALFVLSWLWRWLTGPRTLESELRAHRAPAPLPAHLANNRFLTREQCLIAFPKLEDPIKPTVDYWRKRGGILESWVFERGNTEQGRALVFGNRVYVKRYKNFRHSREQAIIHALRDAVITSTEPLPNIDFAFRSFDNQEYYTVEWQMMRQENEPGAESVWLMEYLLETDRVESEQPWEDKSHKLFWRGAMLSDGRRELVKIANGTSWGDVDGINWERPDQAAPRIDMWDFCRYRYLAHTKGINEWYSGRLKYLFACDSVTIQRPVVWEQHFHPAIDSIDGSPTQNTVIVRNDSWADLPRVIQELEANPRWARLVARNARDTFRHRWLTPAATNCYWRALIRAYASVQAFEPTKYGGVDAESFSLLSLVEWEPY